MRCLKPQAQVHLLLISDTPAQLLPTIKSRVQQLALQTIEPTVAVDYVTQALGHTINREAVGTAAIEQLIQLANGAPLAAIALAQASWQSQLNIKEFIQLSELMLLDIRRVCLGLVELQKDVNLSTILATYQPTDSGLEAFANSVQQTKIALQQNVQEKFAYDKLMQELASL